MVEPLQLLELAGLKPFEMTVNRFDSANAPLINHPLLNYRNRAEPVGADSFVNLCNLQRFPN
jgi:hypothetical protein